MNNLMLSLLKIMTVLTGVDAWGQIAFADGLMILRDSTSMVCLNLREEN